MSEFLYFWKWWRTADIYIYYHKYCRDWLTKVVCWRNQSSNCTERIKRHYRIVNDRKLTGTRLPTMHSERQKLHLKNFFGKAIVAYLHRHVRRHETVSQRKISAHNTHQEQNGKSKSQDCFLEEYPGCKLYGAVSVTRWYWLDCQPAYNAACLLHL